MSTIAVAATKSWFWFKSLPRWGKVVVVLLAMAAVGRVVPSQPEPATTATTPTPEATPEATPEPTTYVAPVERMAGNSGLTCDELHGMVAVTLDDVDEATSGIFQSDKKAFDALARGYQYQEIYDTYC